MITLSPLRWGKPYESLDFTDVVHFDTGEPIARIGNVGGGIVGRDMRKAHQAREALLQLSTDDLIERCKRAAVLFESSDLKVGDSTQSVDQFVHQQSASTGLPEHMCKSNMPKNSFVLSNMDQILDCLTRGLDLSILSRGYGEEDRGVIVSYQAQTPILGAVLPNNSPGVHTLWLPAIPLQIGLALKPGSQEPWTPYRMVSAFIEAGVPAEAFGLYPGGHDAGGAIMTKTPRSMIFGSAETVAQHAGNPKVQAHGPGFSKILIGDDVVDDWEDYLDLMVESVLSNSGRSCINCSGIWASRNTREIAAAIAKQIGPVDVLPPSDPNSQLAAFTVPAMATGTYAMVEQDLAESGVERPDRGVRRKTDRARALRVPAADGRSRRFTRSASRLERVHVPVRECGRVSTKRDAEKNRPDAGRQRVNKGPSVDRCGRRMHRDRPSEYRTDPNQPSELAATARGQHHRLPVPIARLPDR